MGFRINSIPCFQLLLGGSSPLITLLALYSFSLAILSSQGWLVLAQGWPLLAQGWLILAHAPKEEKVALNFHHAGKQNHLLVAFLLERGLGERVCQPSVGVSETQVLSLTSCLSWSQHVIQEAGNCVLRRFISVNQVWANTGDAWKISH